MVGSMRHVNMFGAMEAKRILRRSQRMGFSKVSTKYMLKPEDGYRRWWKREDNFADGRKN
jgi:hypothetical protein